MAVATREQVMNALLAYIQAGCGTTFQTYSRRFFTWEQITQPNQGTLPVIQQPALFLYDGVGFGGGREHWQTRGRGTPMKVILHRTIVIYARLPGGGTPTGPDSITAGGTVLHPLIESVTNAIHTPDTQITGLLTLGGLVQHCWINGDALIVTGEIDPGQGQGMATLPVEILLSPSL